VLQHHSSTSSKIAGKDEGAAAAAALAPLLGSLLRHATLVSLSVLTNRESVVYVVGIVWSLGYLLLRA